MTRSRPSSVIKVMRELASAYHTLHSYDAHHLKQFDMTPAQADVICELGTEGVMCCGELAENVLIPRGSLSGVLERLEERGLIQRAPSRQDRRKMLIRLTDTGKDLFSRVFPGRISRMAERFDQLDEETQGFIVDALRQLRHTFI
jgi:DNA-binding MarR family transcriptional regulator